MINYVIYDTTCSKHGCNRLLRSRPDYVPVPKHGCIDYRFAAGLCDVEVNIVRMPSNVGCLVKVMTMKTTTMINYVIYEVVDYVPERMPECRVSGQSDDDEDYYDDKLCDLRSRGLCSCSETWVYFDYRFAVGLCDVEVNIGKDARMSGARMPECRVSGQSDDDEDYYDDKLCDLRSRGLCSCSGNMGALRLS
ncbi:hypothetical protein CEXT_277631 [Caerostris extrusa]|uniref:Uncharacterized protein n=1 Tax=Caerostris extrusa TaxID=172846 RepID=A0AAV4P008_CAEEX|nr:hypothetical protein CEXT_277631 [Caerostris extrusa]